MSIVGIARVPGVSLDREDTHRLTIAVTGCPAWCVDCWGPSPLVPGDETLHNGPKSFVQFRSDIEDHEVSVNLARFDDPAEGGPGEVIVYLKVDGVGVEMPLSKVQELRAALDAVIARAQTAEAAG